MQQPQSLSEQRCTDVPIVQVRVQRQDGDEWRSEVLILLLPRPLYWWDAEGRNAVMAATRITLGKTKQAGRNKRAVVKRRHCGFDVGRAGGKINSAHRDEHT